MRSIPVFLRDATEEQVVKVLDVAYPGQRRPWLQMVLDDPCLYIDFAVANWSDFDPDHHEDLRARFGGEPTVAIAADVSGRHQGRPQILEFVSLLLSQFDGLAYDDYTDHLWPLRDIAGEITFNGLRFFDCRSSITCD